MSEEFHSSFDPDTRPFSQSGDTQVEAPKQEAEWGDFDQDLPTVEKKVKYKHKEYILREASADAGCRYRNFILQNMSPVPGTSDLMPGRNMQDSEPLLVSLCLFELVQDPSGIPKEKPVTIQWVRSLPNRIMASIYRKICDISDLNQGVTEDQLVKQITKLQEQLNKLRAGKTPAKNGQGATTDSSV